MSADDLIAFLNARLDEDEAAANRGLRFAEDRERDCPDVELVEMCERASRRERNYDQPWWAATVMALRQQVQLAPHDPARVLREIGAKRAILAEHHCDDTAWCTRCQDPVPDAREDEDRFAPVYWPCLTLRALSAVYSDHPEYREEWKP